MFPNESKIDSSCGITLLKLSSLLSIIWGVITTITSFFIDCLVFHENNFPIYGILLNSGILPSWSAFLLLINPPIIKGVLFNTFT